MIEPIWLKRVWVDAIPINGWRLEASEVEVVEKKMVAVTSGALAKSELADWVRRHVQVRSDKG